MTSSQGALLQLVRGIARTTLCGLLASVAFGQPSSTSPLAPPPNGPRRADPTWIALADCTVHPVPGAAMEHATLLVRDGRIIGVLPGEAGTGKDGKPATLPARMPIGPRVINCSGLHLYPGFIDPYVEVDAPAPSGDDSSKHWNPKVTPQRSALDGAGLDEGTASGLRRMGFTAATIAPKGGIFRGRSAMVSLAKASDEPSADKTAVYADNLYQTVFMDTSGGGYPDSQMGAIAVIRQSLSDAVWQLGQRGRQVLISPPNAIDWLIDPRVSFDASVGSFPVRPKSWVFNTDSELDLFRVDAIVKEFNLGNVIMLGSGTEYRRPAALSASTKLVLPVNFPKAPDVGSLSKQEGTDLREMMAWEQGPTNPRRVNAMGVNFMLSTAKLANKGDFWPNLRTAIKYGLPEDVALAAITVRPAAALGVQSIMGTLEQGKIANIAVFDGPVFGKNAENRESKLRGVWIDGLWHELSAIPVSFEGQWELSIPSDPRKVTRSLEIDRDNGVTVHRDDKTVKASKVEAASGRLSFVFDHDALDGQEGTCSMMALVSTPDGGAAPATMTGIGISGTGKRYEWVATRKPASLSGTWPLVADAAGSAPLPVLSFGKENALAVRVAAAAADAKAIKPADVSYDGSSFTFTLDGSKVHGVLDWSKTPALISGATKAADGTTTFWTGARREANPFVGTWTITSLDGKPPAEAMKPAAEPAKPADEPKPENAKQDDGKNPEPKKPADDKESFTMKVTSEAVTLTFKVKGKEAVVIKAKDVKFTGLPDSDDASLSLTFTHDLAPLGGEGTSTDTVTITFGAAADKDTLAGASTLSTGGTHAYACSREAEKKADDDAAPTDIPEKIPTPFSPWGFEQLPEQPTNLIISNAVIWTNGKAGTISRGYIHVRSGKIVAVGAGDPTIAVPKGESSTYIDAKGRHVTPGIIDCHSHTGISGGVNEGGQAITSECRIGDVTNPDATNWYQQLAGGVTCVNNLHGSANAIGGQSQTNKIRWGCEKPDDMHFEGAMPGIKFALGENPRRANGGDGSRYPATRMGVEMIIRDRFTAASEYLAARNTIGFRRDLELEPLAEILEGKRLVHSHSYRQDEMLMLALVARDFKFRIGTYQHALEGYKVADYVRDYSGGASGFADWWAYKMEVQDAIPEAFPIMAEQGVTVSYNSDSNEMARRLNGEAAKAVKYSGVSEEEALKYVTLNPAKQLRIDGRVGSLEEGKDADLAIWSLSPLSAFTRCEATYVDGRCLFSIEQDKVMRERVKTERLRLIQKLLTGGKKKDASEKKDDAKPDAGDRPRPDGQRRRRGPRPPQEETTIGTEQEAAAEAIKQYYIQLNNYHHFNEQGVCGCGAIK